MTFTISFLDQGATVLRWEGYQTRSDARRAIDDADLIIPLHWTYDIVAGAAADDTALDEIEAAPELVKATCPSCAKNRATREQWDAVEGGSVNHYWRVSCPCGFTETNDIFR